MRFAVLSDIQANVAALEAVLRDIDARWPPIDRIFSAGDLVGRGPNPNEVMDMCRVRGIDSVLGNYDDAVAFDRLGSGADFASGQAEADDAIAVSWTKRSLTSDNLDSLRRTPRDLRLYPAGTSLNVRRNSGDVRPTEYQRTLVSRLVFGTLLRERTRTSRVRVTEVLLIHGTPRALNELLREDTATSIVTRIAEEARADVVVTGHAGTGFRRDVGRTTFVGVGSVSGAHAQLGVAEYAVVEVGDGIGVDFGRVAYDPGPYLRSMRQSNLPPYISPV